MTTAMSDFDDIRPYNDNEVRATLDRILADKEFSLSVAKLRFPRLTRALPWLMQPIAKSVLSKELGDIQCVNDVQTVVEKYLRGMMGAKDNTLTSSGIEKLDPKQAYLFVSNHRDIAMDSAFIGWSLYQNNLDTTRNAIGDNLLSKPFVSDLMRLNKSFIVNRSATKPREKFKAAKHLSSYIHHSLVNEKANIWIAQREGRAKDGLDQTNSAVIGMFGLSKPKSEDYGEYISKLNIVPVSISYEWDPCDAAKTRELYEQSTQGSYAKSEHEDIESIAKGIAGRKGSVHAAFGDVISADFDSADRVVAEIDRQIIGNYILQPSNCFAYLKLHGELPTDVRYSSAHLAFDATQLSAEKAEFEQRLAAIPTQQQAIFLAMYANPIVSKYHKTA